MSTITVVLGSHADGTLHLPVPEELRGKKLRVTATIEEASEPGPDPKRGTKNALEAFEQMWKLGGLSHALPDPVTPPREQRDDAQAPGGQAARDPARGTKTVLEALEELRKRGGLGDVIPDPVAWQREQRKDRSLWPEP
jgi:hypothetical protein